MDSNRKITKKFTKKFNSKFINGQYFHGKTGVKYYSLLAVNIFFCTRLYTLVSGYISGTNMPIGSK